MMLAEPSCNYIQFGLIVTGVGEEKHLPKLFKSLMDSKICGFKVIRRIGQRSPITSKKRKLKMIGSGKVIPDKDTIEIGLPARQFLNKSKCTAIVLIDDLEYDRQIQVQAVYERYRSVFDTVLDRDKSRASVHFLVNMLEAYYFAHSEAVNDVLQLKPPLKDYKGDVETIRHPKNELKALYSNFDEVDHGGKILGKLDVEYILANPNTCASLRTLFAWCVAVLKTHYKDFKYCETMDWNNKYNLDTGIFFEITKPQLDDIPVL